MNEKEKLRQRAQEVFDAMTQETRGSLEEVARPFYDDEDEDEVRELSVEVLALLLAIEDADAAEFATRDLIEGYLVEEGARLKKLPEYSKKGIPLIVLSKAVIARLLSEHPAAARFSPPAE